MTGAPEGPPSLSKEVKGTEQNPSAERQVDCIYTITLHGEAPLGSSQKRKRGPDSRSPSPATGRADHGEGQRSGSPEDISGEKATLPLFHRKRRSAAAYTPRIPAFSLVVYIYILLYKAICYILYMYKHVYVRVLRIYNAHACRWKGGASVIVSLPLLAMMLWTFIDAHTH